jgi:hypothetical protein
VGTQLQVETITADPDSEQSDSDAEELEPVAYEADSVHRCAAAHIKAGNLIRNEDNVTKTLKELVDCWESHKNNNNKRAYASTCYHQLDQHERARPKKKYKSAMIDTGANITLLDREAEDAMSDGKESRIRIEVADKRCVKGNKDGTVHMRILKMDKKCHEKASAVMTDTGITRAHKVTTIENLSRQLFSVDDMYLQGCSILLRAPGYENGLPEIHVPATNASEEYCIPLRYDHEEGGFWLDYCLEDSEFAADESEADERKYDMPRIDGRQAAFLIKALHDCEAVKQVELVQEAEEPSRQERCAMAAQDVQFDQHPDATKINIRGVKMGLKSAKKQMRADDFHEDHGHLGCVGKCIVCTLARGCARAITQVIDRYTEVRRGHTWDGDILTWEHRSEQGNKYQITLRDRMSRAVKYLYIKNRDDALEAVKEWIVFQRTLPEFQDMGYEFASLLVLDRAGEWGEENQAWDKFMAEVGFETMWTCPDNKKEASRAERTVGIAEVTQKALLLQRALHHSWWQVCGDAAEFLLNRFPSTRTDKTMPIDGDQARPIEILTGGKHSRRQCDRELSYFVAPGTPALVHDTKAKGSQLDNLKSTWKIAKGMYREQVRWWSPWTRQHSHSKSYTAFKLQKGLSFIDFLGLKGLPKAAREESIQCGFDKDVVIKLPELPPELVKQAKKSAASTQPLIAVKHAVEQLESSEDGTVQYAVPEVLVKDAASELGGSVRVFDHEGQELSVNPETGALKTQKHQIQKESENLKSGLNPETGALKTQKPQIQKGLKKPTEGTQRSRSDSEAQSGNVSHVLIERSAELEELWDKAEADAARNETYTTGTEDRFVRICKTVFKLPHQQHQLCRQWILEHVRLPDGRKIMEDDLPMERGMCMPPGMRLPKPTGSAWRALIEPSEKLERDLDDLNATLLAMAIRGVHRELNDMDPNEIKQGRASFAKASAMSEEETRTAMHVKQIHREYSEDKRACAAKVRRQKAVAADSIPEPRNTREALERDPIGWSKSIREEVGPLIEMGVLDEGPDGIGYTKAQLLEEGIDINVKKAVGLGLYHTHKFDKEGEIDRLKSRAALQGHKGNMQRGNHFTETFTPTPKEDIARILLALMCLFNLFRMTGDVVKAYCWAPLPPGDLIAVKYPPGLKKFHPTTGEETFMILRKNLYGHPAAGRSWGKLRDSELLKHFNMEGWKCRQCEMDPCLFYITKDEAWALVSIHTDDMDAVGTDMLILNGIFDLVDKIWELKRTDPELMLGVVRKVTHDSDGKVESCEQTMEAYIRGMADSFREHLPTKTVQSFLPPKTSLSKFEKPPELEVKGSQDKGYNRAVGMIVWAVRHVAPIGKYGVTQLCSVMATPGKQAFEAAMNAIAFLEQRAKKGIKFSAKGNRIPVFMSDASNKPDPNDGKCHAGFTGHLANGPIISKSFKLKHRGLSSEHNEYMGLTACLRAVVWIRQLLGEIGMDDLIKEPTTVYGDNIQANRLCKEHFVSSGNQHIYMPYHWNREVINNREATIKWVQTTHNISDLMSKNVTSAVSKQLDGLLSGYEDISKLVLELETSPRLHTDDNRKLGGVSR